MFNMPHNKMQPAQEQLVRTMLDEDRDDTVAYMSDRLTPNALRTATQNLQAVCDIVSQLLSKHVPDIRSAYAVANTVATGFLEGINVFNKIKQENVDSIIWASHNHKGINIGAAYSAKPLADAKTEYIINAAANIINILDLTAHIISRENVSISSLRTAKNILDLARFDPDADIVAKTDMDIVWKALAKNGFAAINGPNDPSITGSGNQHSQKQVIAFRKNSVSLNGQPPVASVRKKRMRLYRFENNALLCVFHSGSFSAFFPNNKAFHGKIRLAPYTLSFTKTSRPPRSK